MTGMPHFGGNGPLSASGAGGVLWIEPPHFVDEKGYARPILYGYVGNLSPLSQAALRGMKTTVRSLLHNNASIVDIGYNRVAPSDSKAKQLHVVHRVKITPLQIACAQYVATRQSKYIEIISQLVASGANIHAASFFHQSVDPLDLRTYESMKVRRNTMKSALQRLSKAIALNRRKESQINEQLRQHRAQTTLPPTHIDLNALMRLTRENAGFLDRFKQIENELKLYENEMKAFEERMKVKRLINASPYVMGLKERQTCSDTAIIEGFVKGAIEIKERLIEFSRDGWAKGMNEEIAQVVVEHVIGLPLRLWDV